MTLDHCCYATLSQHKALTLKQSIPPDWYYTHLYLFHINDTVESIYKFKHAFDALQKYAGLTQAHPNHCCIPEFD